MKHLFVYLPAVCSKYIFFFIGGVFVRTPKRHSDFQKGRYNFEYSGKKFYSIKKCCDFYEINYRSVMSYQLRNQCSMADAITYYRDIKDSQKVIFHNRTWKNMTTCCNYYDLNEESVKSYMYENQCTKEEALEHAYQSKKKREFLYHGIRYASFADCCRAYQISPENVQAYIQRTNLSPTRAISYYIKREQGKFLFRDVMYKNFSQCCKTFHIPSSTIRSCMAKNHFSKQKALEYLLEKREERIFIWEGKEYPSFGSCCKVFDINESSARSRAYRIGCSLKESFQHYISLKQGVSIPTVNPKVKDGFVFRGKKYPSFSECCRNFGFNPATVQSYKNYHKISGTEALEQYLDKVDVFVFRGINYKNFQECCNSYLVPENTVIYHIKHNGMSQEEALEHVLQLKSKRTFWYHEVEYPSFSRCCKELNVNKHSVYSYAKRLNCSLQDAISYFLDK